MSRALVAVKDDGICVSKSSDGDTRHSVYAGRYAWMKFGISGDACKPGRSWEMVDGMCRAPSSLRSSLGAGYTLEYEAPLLSGSCPILGCVSSAVDKHFDP